MAHLRTFAVRTIVVTTIALVAGLLALMLVFPSSKVVSGVLSGVIILMVAKHVGLLALLLGSGSLFFPGVLARFRAVLQRGEAPDATLQPLPPEATAHPDDPIIPPADKVTPGSAA
jgi:hypothetical protein